MWNDISKLTKSEKPPQEDAKLSHELPCLTTTDDSSEKSRSSSEKNDFKNTVEINNMNELLNDDEEQNEFTKRKRQILSFCEDQVEQLTQAADERINRSGIMKSTPENIPGTSGLNKNVSCSNTTIRQTSKTAKKPSRDLPVWVWRIIERTLGIPKKSREKPWLATTIYLLTFVSALTFIASYSWFVVYDISSLQTKRDALNGIVSMVIATFWSSLAVYANHLAYRMFKHEIFAKNIKLHSKTILKCNGAIILIFCGLLFIILSDYVAFQEFNEEACGVIELEIVVCKTVLISRTVFSFFAFIWNVLIAFVMMAVCRTHTLDIRQFINRLYEDAKVYDKKYSMKFGIKSSFLFNNSSVRDYIANPRQGEGYSLFEDNESDADIMENNENFTLPSSCNQSFASIPNPNADTTDQTEVNRSQEMEFLRNRNQCQEEHFSRNSSINIPLEPPTPPDKENLESNYLTQSQILHHYWKLQCQIWMSSSMLQRWMVCFMCLCVIWIGVTLVHWLSNSPTTLGVVLFIIPLIMLPVLCSAYAEVNNEGQRMIRSVSPSEDRLWMLFYLHQAPLQMTIYGFPIKYSTVVTTMFGLVAALTSGIVLQEIKAL